MQLGLAILVTDDVHNAMRRLQLTVAEHCGRNPALKQTPHITIKQPFHAKALGPVEEYFDTLVSTLERFPVRLRGIGFFEEDAVAYVGLEPDPRLERLRLRVLQGLSDRFGVRPREIEDERYRFHATLAYGLPGEQFPRVRAALAGAHVDFQFMLDTMGLFYYTGEEWIVYKRSSAAC